MKDVMCRRAADLEQALLEVSLLRELDGAGSCIPKCLGHSVHHLQDGSSVVRFAMTRLQGVPLEDFLSGKPCLATDSACVLRRGIEITRQLVMQLGQALSSVNKRVWHRDVNPRNVLISDMQSGLGFDAAHSAVENVRFGLIDFGLAVDSRTWSSKWSSSSIAGDCRYWPASSWLMSFHGAHVLRQHHCLLQQYETKLDSYALGVLALELLCGCLMQCQSSELGAGWQLLLAAFTSFHSDMHRWNQEVNSVFSTGGNPQILRQKYQQEGVAMKVQRHAAAVSKCLRVCFQNAAEPRLGNLLRVLAELLDERSFLTALGAVDAVSSEKASQLVATRSLAPSVTHMRSCHLMPSRPTERPLPLYRAATVHASASPALFSLRSRVV